MTAIRHATATDAQEVHRLIELLETPQRFAYEPFCQNYRKNLANPDIAYFIAEEDGRVLAFGSLQFSTPLHHDRPVAEIVELVVDDACRGGGVGARMVAAMEELAHVRGCCSLELSTNRVRRRAHLFYYRAGFQLTHYRLTKVLDGE